MQTPQDQANGTSSKSPLRRFLGKTMAKVPAAPSGVGKGTQPVAAVSPDEAAPVWEIPDGADGMYTQPFFEKWGRRALTIPALTLATTLYGAAMPALLTYGFFYDKIKGRRQLLVRFHSFVFGILAWHLVGIAILTGSWFWAPPILASLARRIDVARKVETWYIPRTIAIAEKIYNMKIEIEGIEEVAPGPVLLLSRHASVLDTIMPIKLLGQAHGMVCRIVQKHELLVDPVVDIASHRIPRAFVKRGTGNANGQIPKLLHLMGGMDEDDAFVIFPEGSRFTPKKKDKIVAKLAEKNPAAAARAARLKHLLPVRPQGTMALMDARPDMDVVFLAHTGLEGANKVENFINGALLDRTVKIKFWRVNAADIPTDRAEREAWLNGQWDIMDRWITENYVA